MTICKICNDMLYVYAKGVGNTVLSAPCPMQKCTNAREAAYESAADELYGKEHEEK